MPRILIQTNVVMDETMKKTLFELMTNFIEIELHKPKQYAMIQIQDNIATCFAGDYTTPAAMVTVESITSSYDNIGNKSRQIAIALQKIAGIPSTRIYVHYVTASEKNFSWKI